MYMCMYTFTVSVYYDVLISDKSNVPSGREKSIRDICALVGIVHLIGGMFLYISV